MAASKILASYSSETFNKVPDFMEQVPKLSKINLTDILLQTGKVFAKHGATSNWGLGIIHRHFTLNLKEILVSVERNSGTGSTAFPIKFDGCGFHAADPENGQLDEMAKSLASISPATFCFDAKGKLQTIEFYGSSCPTDETQKWPPSSLAAELFNFLKVRGLESVFGIVKISAIDQGKWEWTDLKNRCNITTPSLVKPKHGTSLLPVSWAFSKDGKSSFVQQGCIVGSDEEGPCHENIPDDMEF